MIYDDIINKLKIGEPFAFSRWGDGEWLNVNGLVGSNCDGNIYYEDLGNELKNIVSVPQDYYLGVQTLVSWSVEQANKYPQDWSDSDVFHKASKSGKLQSFIDVLFDVYVVYIGNGDLSKLNFIDKFVNIPYNNVWLQRDQLIQNLRNTFDDTHKVYLFSAGMATNVFIDQLWKTDKTNTYIDVGSVFDPYVGKITRTYHKSLNLSMVKKYESRINNNNS